MALISEFTNKNLNISDRNSDFINQIKNSKNNFYDNIYSNFFLFDYSDNDNDNNENNNKIKYYKEEKKIIENKKIKGFPKKERSINKIKNNNLKLYLNKNKKQYKINLANYNNYNDVSERLYNNSFLTKTKIDIQRKMRDDAFKENLVPKINLKAKKIKGDEKRLYNEDIIKKMRKNLSQKNIYEKDKSCSFKPDLDKKSLKIAEYLEPSTYRLNKKKCKINKDEIIDLTKKNYANLFGNKIDRKYIKNKNYNNRKRLYRSTENINKKIDDFYKKQIEKVKLKEKIYNENKLKKEKEYQKYPFHPIIRHKNSINSLNKTHIDSHINTFERLYKTNKSCKKKIHFNEIKTTDLCTFKPNISPLNIKDDKKMIMNNITQNNLYILKRRQNIESQKNLEKYKNKKMGKIYGFFKPVIAVKENGLRTERRSTSRGNKSLNKEENNKYIITKGTVDFNNESNINKNEKIYYYLNDENNNMNITSTRYTTTSSPVIR